MSPPGVVGIAVNVFLILGWLMYLTYRIGSLLAELRLIRQLMERAEAARRRTTRSQ